MRPLILCLLATGCAIDPSTTSVPDAPAAPLELTATLLTSWSGQDVVTSNPNDSRVPRTLTGPARPCPNVVGDDVVQVDIEVVIGNEDAYVFDETFACSLGHTTIPLPAGSGTVRLDVITASGNTWLSAYGPITTIAGQTTDGGTANLDTELPTSGGGGDGDGGGLGGFF